MASAAPKYIKLERLWLKEHPDLDERWVQDRIADDPAILGLGEIVLKDKERVQPRAGRLDLLFQDAETNRRYEVEVQLGRTDETHIIRTIEYWDIERKRYPQYDHCAVIVAEDISSRFLNVIGLFNGTIPLIAIQMQAMKVGDGVALVFSTVLDEMTRGLEEEDDDAIEEPTDRGYWEERATKATVAMVDQLLLLVRDFDQRFELKYNKFYIGLTRNGQPHNFVTFRPTKKSVRLSISLKQSEDVERRIEESGLDPLEYDKRGGRYRLRLAADDLGKNRDVLRELMKLSYDDWNA